MLVSAVVLSLLVGVPSPRANRINEVSLLRSPSLL